ncbi:MAG TPA: ParB/RepB/Spo0J family partition protein [Geminicoccus sp.]|jgi:ParB family chromosome partitioning protein|uniref:ParB/RepB/Spo0J family partition protein n=1 Tax=Geminicoccus sp. TaxID=2024832 RepID=UPI002E2FCFCC|nr:ParB/RepB/Spo0J family partition protein [Geminicoccus sp.]HEX2528833.1 ParB/RepB/Spo0J family partition protein [Geminicoccus sp.]
MPSSARSAKPARPTLRDRLAADSLFKTSVDLPKIVELDLATIDPDPDQPRRHFDEQAIAELAGSIDVHGLLQPILVRRSETPGRWVIVAGERRWRATRFLERPTIAAIVSNGDPLEIALVENLQREQLGPFEEAAAVERLMQDKGWTQDEVGRAVGKRQNTVSALLSLSRLPERIREEYAATPGIGRSLLVELAQVQEEAEQLRLWDLAKSGLATVRQVRLARRSEGTQKPPLPAAKADRLSDTGRRLLADLDRVAPGKLDPSTRVTLQMLWERLGRMLAAQHEESAASTSRR